MNKTCRTLEYLDIWNLNNLFVQTELFPTPDRQWPGRPGFNPRSSHTKDSKMVLDASLLNPQHYNVWIKGKVEQSKEMSSALPYTLV